MSREHPYAAAFIFAALAFFAVGRAIITGEFYLLHWGRVNAERNPIAFRTILTFLAMFGILCMSAGFAALTEALAYRPISN